MLPTIVIGPFTIPMFSLCAIAGVTSFVLITLARLRHCESPSIEASYIIPKIFIALGAGLVGAIMLDALFKIPINGGFKISGITFYGGAVTGIAVLAVLIALLKKNTELSTLEWLDLLTVPFLVFHFLGRIGCFLGGCCYGKATDGPFGVLFPDNPSVGIFHGGHKVYPTQLFEAAGLAAIIVTLILIRKHNFLIYCFSYPIMRFCIEFLRGDNRGGYIGALSPSQFISVLIVGGAIIFCLIRFFRSQHEKRKRQPKRR